MKISIITLIALILMLIVSYLLEAQSEANCEQHDGAIEISPVQQIQISYSFELNVLTKDFTCS